MALDHKKETKILVNGRHDLRPALGDGGSFQRVIYATKSRSTTLVDLIYP